MKIEVHAERLHGDPALVIYRVELESPDGAIWREVFGTPRELKVWLDGLRAGHSMAGGGFLRLPDVPREGEIVGTDTIGSYRVT